MFWEENYHNTTTTESNFSTFSLTSPCNSACQSICDNIGINENKLYVEWQRNYILILLDVFNAIGMWIKTGLWSDIRFQIPDEYSCNKFIQIWSRRLCGELELFGGNLVGLAMVGKNEQNCNSEIKFSILGESSFNKFTLRYPIITKKIICQTITV